MPYKSKAQQRKFHVDPELRDKYSKEWDEETKKTKKGFKGLPERVKKKKKSSKSAAKNTTKKASKRPRSRSGVKKK